MRPTAGLTIIVTERDVTDADPTYGRWRGRAAAMPGT
jgi:hypothetical protein